MISGHATLDDAVRATKAGAYDFIEKPLDRERVMVALRNALERRAMEREVQGLRAVADERYEMVGKSAPMAALFAQIAKVAPTRTRVLITGECGTGKELIARAIHRASALADKPFVKVNCAAIPPELIEASCSATSAARSPAPPGASAACSRSPTAARSSSTRSATWSRRRRRRCCACCRRASSRASAASRR